MTKKIYIIGLIFCAFLLFGCSIETKSNQSTVTVSGIGSVLVSPDMVQMTINFSHVARTTREAKAEVDDKIRQILKILKDEGIEDKNIKTISINYDVEIDYKTGRSEIIGQRAEQTIVVTMYDIIDYPNKFPQLLDKITAIDRVAIRNIIFDTENKTEIFKQSRELAYQKALDKANQYADLSGRKIEKVLTISEERSRDVYRFTAQSNVAYDSAEFRGGASVPTGEQEVTSEITITFLMK